MCVHTWPVTTIQLPAVWHQIPADVLEQYGLVALLAALHAVFIQAARLYAGLLEFGYFAAALVGGKTAAMACSSGMFNSVYSATAARNSTPTPALLMPDSGNRVCTCSGTADCRRSSTSALADWLQRAS
jgi:hypothetical protein